MSPGWIDASLFRDFQAEGTAAHRLCTMEDGWVERFGHDILISFKRVLVRERLIQELKEWADGIPFKFERIFARFVPRKSEQREPPRLICGNPTENLQAIATERRLKFGIDFGAGFSVGLFPDQRENHSFVRHLAPKRLLNCFAYTCSFSVSAAYVGVLTRHQTVDYAADIGYPGPGAIAPRRPYYNQFPNVSGITLENSDAISNYHALQLSLEHRFSHACYGMPSPSSA